MTNFYLGVICGEGSFTTGIECPEKGIIYVKPMLRVEMADEDTVKGVRNWLGVGTLSTRDRESRWSRTWTVCAKGKRASQVVVDKVDSSIDQCPEFKNSSKGKQYRIWKRLVSIIEKNGNTRGTEKMVDIAHAISGQRDEERIEMLKENAVPRSEITNV